MLHHPRERHSDAAISYDTGQNALRTQWHSEGQGFESPQVHQRVRFTNRKGNRTNTRFWALISRNL